MVGPPIVPRLEWGAQAGVRGDPSTMGVSTIEWGSREHGCRVGSRVQGQGVQGCVVWGGVGCRCSGIQGGGHRM